MKSANTSRGCWRSGAGCGARAGSTRVHVPRLSDLFNRGSYRSSAERRRNLGVRLVSGRAQRGYGAPPEAVPTPGRPRTMSSRIHCFNFFG
jgi:hypothetical protein